ncbi:3-methyl-2-oxobutanoate hydroxymethyltransferase [Bradyrhizobium yuanmingense]|uniref:3-methyl-2-oxobutanoate hydroxymethyltransferase n=1 Tax=Bradyrhizobium yuanmingense TaxID=108015 RepID=UPI0035181F70
METEGLPIAMTTAYDAVTARIADTAVDIILVGDSVGKVCPGRPRYASHQHGNDESSPGSSLAHKASCAGCGRHPVSQLSSQSR